MNNNQHLLECSAHTPLWELVLLVVFTIVLFVIIVSMGKEIYSDNKEIKKLKNK